MAFEEKFISEVSKLNSGACNAMQGQANLEKELDNIAKNIDLFEKKMRLIESKLTRRGIQNEEALDIVSTSKNNASTLKQLATLVGKAKDDLDQGKVQELFDAFKNTDRYQLELGKGIREKLYIMEIQESMRVGNANQLSEIISTGSWLAKVERSERLESNERALEFGFAKTMGAYAKTKPEANAQAIRLTHALCKGLLAVEHSPLTDMKDIQQLTHATDINAGMEEASSGIERLEKTKAAMELFQQPESPMQSGVLNQMLAHKSWPLVAAAVHDYIKRQEQELYSTRPWNAAAEALALVENTCILNAKQFESVRGAFNIGIQAMQEKREYKKHGPLLTKLLEHCLALHKNWLSQMFKSADQASSQLTVDDLTGFENTKQETNDALTRIKETALHKEVLQTDVDKLAVAGVHLDGLTRKLNS